MKTAKQLAEENGHQSETASTTLNTVEHHDTEYDLRVCGVGDGAYFEWLNSDTGLASGEMFYEIEESDLTRKTLPADHDDCTHKIVRKFQDPNKDDEFVKGDLTREEARDHCSDPSSSGDGWMDVFYVE